MSEFPATRPPAFPATRPPAYSSLEEAPEMPEDPQFPFALIEGLPFQWKAYWRNRWRPLRQPLSPKDDYVMVAWSPFYGAGAWTPAYVPQDPKLRTRLMARAHQIVWFLHHGQVPPGLELDHINGIKQDNRIENLRLATRAENLQHARALRGNWAKAKITPQLKEQALALPTNNPTTALALAWIAKKAGVTVGHLRNLRGVESGNKRPRISLAKCPPPFTLNSEDMPTSYSRLPNVQHHLVRGPHTPVTKGRLKPYIGCSLQTDGSYRLSWAKEGGDVVMCSLARVVWFLSRGEEHPGRIRYRDGNKANLRASNLY